MIVSFAYCHRVIFRRLHPAQPYKQRLLVHQEREREGKKIINYLHRERETKLLYKTCKFKWIEFSYTPDGDYWGSVHFGCFFVFAILWMKGKFGQSHQTNRKKTVFLNWHNRDMCHIHTVQTFIKATWMNVNIFPATMSFYLCLSLSNHMWFRSDLFRSIMRYIRNWIHMRKNK